MKPTTQFIAFIIIICLCLSAGYYFGSRAIEPPDTGQFVPSDKFNELEQAYMLQIELVALYTLKLAEKDSLLAINKEDSIKRVINENKALNELAKYKATEQSELFVTNHNVGYNYTGITAVPVQATFVANQNYIKLKYCNELVNGLSEQIQLIEHYAQGTSFFHHLDPRIKFFFSITGLLMLTQLQWFTGGIILLLGLLGILRISDLPLRFIVSRSIGVLILTGSIIFMNIIFLPRGTPWLVIELPIGFPLIITVESINISSVFLIRVLCSLLLVAFLLFTTPSNVLFQTMRRFHVPSVFVRSTLLTYRYLILLASETRNLAIAYAIRHPNPLSFKEHLTSTGVLITQTLHRSLQHGTRVFQSMEARGYSGRFHSLFAFNSGKRDVFPLLILILALTSWFLGDLQRYSILSMLVGITIPLTIYDWATIVFHFWSILWSVIL